MKRTKYLNKNIAFDSAGNGDGLPVVFLHGFCEDHRMWEEWKLLLPESGNYCFIDLPGFGQSELTDPLSIESMAEAVNAVIVKLKINKFILVGHSMGGYVSLAYAEKYGSKLAGLCMFHSHPKADAEKTIAMRLKSIEFIEKNGHVLYVRQFIPNLFAYDYSKGYQMEVNKLIYYATELKAESIIAALKAMMVRPDRSSVLENIPCPVLFFIGEKDNAIPLENSLPQTLLPAISDVQIYSEIGHMAMFETPRKTAKAFREFMKFCDSHLPKGN